MSLNQMRRVGRAMRMKYHMLHCGIFFAVIDFIVAWILTVEEEFQMCSLIEKVWVLLLCIMIQAGIALIWFVIVSVIEYFIFIGSKIEYGILQRKIFIPGETTEHHPGEYTRSINKYRVLINDERYYKKVCKSLFKKLKENEYYILLLSRKENRILYAEIAEK